MSCPRSRSKQSRRDTHVVSRTPGSGTPHHHTETDNTKTDEKRRERGEQSERCDRQAAGPRPDPGRGEHASRGCISAPFARRSAPPARDGACLRPGCSWLCDCGRLARRLGLVGDRLLRVFASAHPGAVDGGRRVGSTPAPRRCVALGEPTERRARVFRAVCWRPRSPARRSARWPRRGRSAPG